MRHHRDHSHLQYVLVALIAITGFTLTAWAQTTYYVSPCGDDSWAGTSMDCLAFDGPKASIQAAVDMAVNGDTIIVADGTYTGPDNRSIVMDFQITIRSENGPENCIIDCDGLGRFISYQGEGVTTDTVLDGFTVVNGSATNGGAVSCDAGSSPTVQNCNFENNSVSSVAMQWTGLGGAIYVDGGDPVITNCTFTNNSASGGSTIFTGWGGAIFSDGGDPVITDCTFTENAVTGDPATFSAFGGGVLCANGSPTISRCTFTENTATATVSPGGGGGGIGLNACNGIVTDCMFTHNSAQDNAGVFVNLDGSLILGCTFIENVVQRTGGGLGISTESTTLVVGCTFVGNSAIASGGGAGCIDDANPTLVNCLFLRNSTSGEGGGFIAGLPGFPGNSPTLINCTFFENSAATGGGYGQTGPGTGTMRNCILWGDSPDEIIVLAGAVDVTYSDIQGGWPGTGNIDADPLFVDPDGPDNIPGNEDDDLRLSAGSPCIDAGDNNAVPADTPDMDADGNIAEATPFDLDGHPRFVNDPCTPDMGSSDDTNPPVDMGAYEFQPRCPADLDCSGDVGFSDLTDLLAVWGPCAGCPEDLDRNGDVGFSDLTDLLAAWGPCS